MLPKQVGVRGVTFSFEHTSNGGLHGDDILLGCFTVLELTLDLVSLESSTNGGLKRNDLLFRSMSLLNLALDLFSLDSSSNRRL